MKKTQILAVCLAAILTAGATVGTIFAEEYTGTDDPIVAYSYLEKNVLTKLDTLSEELTEYGKRVDTLERKVADLETKNAALETKNEALEKDNATLKAKVAALETPVDAVAPITDDKDKDKTTVTAENNEYEVLCLKAGEIFIAKSAVDVLVRSGTVCARVPATSGGSIPDCTLGTSVENGEVVSLDHLLIIPRGDGRGLFVVSEEAYILVRGAYEIQK